MRLNPARESTPKSSQGFTIALKGNFNPALHHPSWYYTIGQLAKDEVAAVVQLWFPGQECGNAAADAQRQQERPNVLVIIADDMGTRLGTYGFDVLTLVLKAGCYAGNVLDKAGVQALASIPSREELLAKLD